MIRLSATGPEGTRSVESARSSMHRAENNTDLIVRLEDGEDLVRELARLDVDAAILVAGVGMLREAVLGYWNGTGYEKHTLAEPTELLSMQGNFARREAERIVHCHVSLARKDGTVAGGHLIAATVHNTAEIAIRRLPGITLERRPEPSGLVGLYPTT